MEVRPYLVIAWKQKCGLICIVSKHSQSVTCMERLVCCIFKNEIVSPYLVECIAFRYLEKEWNVPDSICRKLVYILFAHGVVGYYAVDRGGCISRIAFGGKLGMLNDNDGPEKCKLAERLNVSNINTLDGMTSSATILARTSVNAVRDYTPEERRKLLVDKTL